MPAKIFKIHIWLDGVHVLIRSQDGVFSASAKGHVATGKSRQEALIALALILEEHKPQN